MRRRKWLGQFCLRLSATLIGVGLLLCLPDPATEELLPYKHAFVALTSVLMVGKLLYDTLFYDRFGS